ncbi:mitochondrial ribosomal death-associated protein 3-domain-containing protein [Chaetomium sp. MPI-SDFR-AT-0129]|nr:mitochondrial ribosomal death-associated protein 3-domain-containing protein [Chaetomium sp. MPI-SDFR-AT-0129]
MSAPNCLRCLVRPSTGLPVSIPRTAAPLGVPLAGPLGTPLLAAASFSTTSSRSEGASGIAKNHHRGGKKTFTVKKKAFVLERGKSPLPGERKAYRKRIILSNDNALAVPWLTDLGPAELSNENNVARVMGIPEEVQDQLRASEAFKTTQCWRMFRKPAVLVRKETVDLTRRMDRAAQNNEMLRLVVTGDKVAGKSLMLLQAMTHAFLNDWVVIHIPEAQELTTACTEYAPIPNTDPLQYMQPVYALKLIQAIKKANEKVLSKTFTRNAHPHLPQNIPANTPLLTLANVAKESEAAWPVFQSLWAELTAQGVARPPILLSIDGLAHMMKISDYRTPAFDLIHSHDLALVRLFANAFGGGLKLPAGGAVIGATSRSNAPRCPSLELAVSRREVEQRIEAAGKAAGAGAETTATATEEVPQRDPYFRGYDDRVEAVLRSVEVLRVGAIDKNEARAVMEYWAASGMFRSVVDTKTVTEKWTLGGNGVLGEMERASLLSMRM